MGRLLKTFFDEAAAAFGGAFASRPYKIDRRGFLTDSKNLRGDFETVGNDLRKTLKREQANYRAR